MTYNTNEKNYATPLSSAPGFVDSSSIVQDLKYLSLSDNMLDGSYVPASGDVGLWGTTISDADGNLSTPFIVTITEEATIGTFRLIGSQYAYPVAFTVKFYNGSTLLRTITETNNASAGYVYLMVPKLTITHYEISITKISKANDVARLYNVYEPTSGPRVDTISIKHNEVGAVFEPHSFKSTDTILVVQNAAQSYVHNTIDVTRDTLKTSSIDVPILTNVHSKMKEPSRRIYGKVYITYTDPMLDSETTVTSSGGAYNSNNAQVLDSIDSIKTKFFTLYDNRLDGTYPISDVTSQVGWVSAVVSNADGNFDIPPYIEISFAERPIIDLSIYFDDSHGSIVEDFTVEYTQLDGNTAIKSYTNNKERQVSIVSEPISNVTAVKVTVTKVSKPYHPAVIVELPIVSTLLYKGYKDESDLISIDLLEELTYLDDIEALGGVSANEVTVVLDNSDKQFYFNNTNSLVAQQLKRNRKIVPWLGVEVVPGEIEWYTLGTFWSYNWTVPTGSLTATVVGFDTIGLLGTTSFADHKMQVNKSIGELIEYVLDDAKKVFNFIKYKIDPELYTVIIPYAWFAASSHTAALQKISGCYPMHIYCDRDGYICAKPQKLHMDFYYDTWADNTNVISKTYDSLYTTLPNIVNVTVNDPTVIESTQLVHDTLEFSVSDFPTRTLNFSKPYIEGLVVSVDCDDTVSYTYAEHSWGIDISFTGTGNVRSIDCSGTVLDTSNSSVITRRDESSIRLNGPVTRDISSDFIQDSNLAGLILNRLFSLSEADKYDATVDYRGDISLTINDPVLLLNGIAPDNRYNIKRHQLFWNGALSGSAELNT